jgi:hypothetical protein
VIHFLPFFNFASIFFLGLFFCAGPIIFWSEWVIGHGKMCGKVKMTGVKN